MSTEFHNTGHGAGRDSGREPVHDDIRFETEDVKATKIYGYLIALAIAVVLSYVICVYVLRVTTRMAEQSDTAPPAVREQMGAEYRAMPPEPRLQGVPGHEQDPQYDMRKKVEDDTAANEQTTWIDQNAGIAQISVKDAMRIIAEKKALPGASAPPAEKKK
ncbi:MAG TPA: hypothetical protein VGI16_06980 [Candidatus Acidoferrum sp.]|jgi:hypothetical protein